MKTAMISLFTVLVAVAASAQTNPGEQRISSPPPGALNSVATNNSAQIPPQGSLTATNMASQTLGELGPQLASLKAAVEQTLPSLTAFNARFANVTPGGSRGQQLASALSGVLSSAFGRNSNSTNSSSSGLTNFAQALSGLVNTNSATGSTNLNPAALSQLRTLQADLTPVLSILQSLDLGSASNTFPNEQGTAPSFSRRWYGSDSNTRPDRPVARSAGASAALRPTHSLFETVPRRTTLKASFKPAQGTRPGKLACEGTLQAESLHLEFGFH